MFGRGVGARDRHGKGPLGSRGDRNALMILSLVMKVGTTKPVSAETSPAHFAQRLPRVTDGRKPRRHMREPLAAARFGDVVMHQGGGFIRSTQHDRFRVERLEGGWLVEGFGIGG